MPEVNGNVLPSILVGTSGSFSNHGDLPFFGYQMRNWELVPPPTIGLRDALREFTTQEIPITPPQ
jgi:hypothetical protein